VSAPGEIDLPGGGAVKVILSALTDGLNQTFANPELETTSPLLNRVLIIWFRRVASVAIRGWRTQPAQHMDFFRHVALAELRLEPFWRQMRQLKSCGECA
jgi:hypothetical protein